MSEPGGGYTDGFEGIPRVRLAAHTLIGLAVAVVALSVLDAGAQLSTLAAASVAPGVTAYLGVLRGLALWTGGAALLWGLAEILLRLDDLPAAVRDAGQRGASGYSAWSGRGADEGDSTRAALAELAVLLREVRDISLLTPPERSLRLKSQADEAARELEKTVPELLRSHNWVEARRRVHMARERFPSQPEWDALERRIEEVRASVEAQDVETVRRQINDLAALGAWERAFDVARDLIERHPDSQPARDLSQMVQNERGRADAEQRSKLMAQVQEAAQRREWSAALSAANALIRQFPTSSEARALRMDLPTLTENTEIQARKRMEAEITELSRSRRFDEALHLARDLIDRYPRSPQADVLREKLPQLESRASARNLR